MNPAAIITDYISWHYSRGLRDFYRISRTYVWFLYNTFSIPELLGTLFAPWRRLGDYEETHDIEGWGEKIIVNTIMRLVGAIVRLTVICVGLLLLTVLILGEIIAWIVWLGLPVILLGLVIGGCILMLA